MQGLKLKTLLAAASSIWFIDQDAAYQYAEILRDILTGKISNLDAGLFSEGDDPYRANSRGLKSESGEVMVIPVFGPMMKSDSCFSSGTASMAKLIAAANSDNSISSIVLHIDSPGGTVDGTEAFASMIAASVKPIVAYGELIASAAYWAASAADEIIISGETSPVGSIGTMATLTNTKALREANGIKDIVIFASRSKDKNATFLEALDGKTENFIKEVLDPLNAVFLSSVEQNRAGKIDLKKTDVLTGKVYYGSTAIEAGLADSKGNLDYAIKRSLQLAKTINK